MSNLEIFTFEGYKDLVECFIELYKDVNSTTELASVSVVAKPYDTRHIVAELLRTTDYTIDLKVMDSEYTDEYYIYILDDEIFVEPAKCDDGEYKYSEDEIVLLLDDCSSKIIHKIDAGVIYETHIQPKATIKKDVTTPTVKCNCDCKCKNEVAPKTDKVVSKSHYYVDGKETTKEEYDKACRLFEKHVNDFLDSFNSMWF